ncbi:MAG: hypothetical protein ACLQQ4_07875 [Bacteroidia bacterium]
MEAERVIQEPVVAFPQPLTLFECDQKDKYRTYEKKGHFLQIHSMQKEVWSLHLSGGQYIIGVGNCFFNRNYRDKLLILVNGDTEIVNWMRDLFVIFKFACVEVPVMFMVHGTTRLTYNPDGAGWWKLYLPTGGFTTGCYDSKWGSPLFLKNENKIRQGYANSLFDYIEELFASIS